MAPPTLSPDDGVGGLLDMAEAMLRLAGEPTTQSDRLAYAQTAAMIGLGRALSRSTLMPMPDDGAGLWGDDLLEQIGKCPQTIVINASKSGQTLKDMVLVMRDIVALIPDWEQKKILAIKEWRARTHMGLKEAKDCIDASSSAQYYGWWQ